MRAVLVVLMTAVAAVGCGREQSGARSVTSEQRDAPTWEELAPPPLSPRSQRVAVWTGKEVLVVGGSTFWCPPSASCAAPDDAPLRDGAALDLQTEEWRPIADAPLPVRSATTAVVGGAVYLLAATGWSDERALLRYEIAADTWEELLLPPGITGWHSLVAAGEHVVAYQMSHEQGRQPDLAYDPRSRTWSELPPPPLTASSARTMVPADGFLYLFDKERVPQPGSERPSLTRAARFDLRTQTWEGLPASEILGAVPWLADDGLLVNPVLGGADGGEVDNWGRTYPHGGMFDTGREEWVPLPPADEGVPSAGAYGTTSALAWDTQGLVLDVAAQRWRHLPPLDERSSAVLVDRTVIAAGRALLAVGGVRTTVARAGPELVNDAWMWRPPGS